MDISKSAVRPQNRKLPSHPRLRLVVIAKIDRAKNVAAVIRAELTIDEPEKRNGKTAMGRPIQALIR
ncbi:hypothetical protein AA14337_3393 [Acetobacter malorum DSM 14337]|uniref:Transposase n=1 Tax=Acetobacter malorum DSM 14337 TaxID=1307910 RepID=A0ABQ0Q1B5_9PROT|nr:hypothetical protein AD930_08030 [Acetobacter malorum]GBQ86704.1 hypothetical protein AA14337_3393 [Acetobacter malorum DSM 14337]